MLAAHANASDELLKGRHLDRYALVYPVARGGMASVWVAKARGKHGFEKVVALKTILPAYSADPRFRRMFLHEAKIAARIEHVNVAQILDLGECDGLLYVAMTWVDGESVEALDRAAERAGRILPIPVVVRIIADLCAGLHAAHELRDANGKPLNVVHRDISPQNILISSDGTVKLIDFGVVKARRDSSEMTTAGIIKGKLKYMPPEQALGHAVDRRADIWAVGATLYRLLARRAAIAGKTPLSVVRRLTEAEPPEPLPSSVPWALTSIVLKALAFDPERRYRTAAELGAALEALLHGHYHTTAREVAACLDLYLGEALSARRAAIDAALNLRTLTDATPVTRPEAFVAARPTDGKRGHLASVAANKQRPRLHSVPSPIVPVAPRARRSRFAVASGVLVLASTLVWFIARSSSDVAPEPEPARPGAAPPPLAKQLAVRAAQGPPPAARPPAHALQLPVMAAELAVAQQPLLSVQALPALRGEAASADPRAVVKASKSSPQRSGKRKTRLAAPKARTLPSMTASNKPAGSAVPERGAIDDGF